MDSVQVFWKKAKYNVKYQLVVNYLNPSIAFESTKDTSCFVRQPSFGSSGAYVLNLFPNHSYGTNDEYKQYNQGYHFLGQLIDGSYLGHGYNFVDRTIYAHNYDDITCYDVDNLSLLRTLKIANSSYRGNFSSSSNSKMLATSTLDYIFLFEDDNLVNPITLSYPTTPQGFDHFFLTNNGLLAVATPNRYELISIDEKKVIASISITDYPVYSKWACFSTSNDGKYASIVTTNGIKLYHIEGSIVTSIYSDSRTYRSVLFNINNPNQILLTYNDNKNLEIRNVPDFSLVKSIELPTKQVMSNFNPDNGLLLLTDYSYLYVVDFDKSKVVFSIKSGTYDWMPHYYGKRLFSKGGCTIDISNYIAK